MPKLNEEEITATLSDLRDAVDDCVRDLRWIANQVNDQEIGTDRLRAMDRMDNDLEEVRELLDDLLGEG